MSERLSAREVLAQAIWASEEPVMSWGFVNERRRGEYRYQADCALKALKANGYAVVELPEPIGPDDDGQLYFGDYDIRVDNTDGSRVGDVWTDYGLGSEVLSQIGVFRARYMGTALLAAAAAAERDSEGRE